MSIFGPKKIRESGKALELEGLQKRLLELELEQRKVGKRYRGGCVSTDGLELWKELSRIKFVNGDFLSVFGVSLILHFRTERLMSCSYKIFTRTMQDGIVRHHEDSGESADLEVKGITLNPDGLDNDTDLFIESWVWIYYENGWGYELELTFYGRLSTVPKCYHYNINYLEH